MTAPLAAFVATTGRWADRARTQAKRSGAEAQRRTAKRGYFDSRCKAQTEGARRKIVAAQPLRGRPACRSSRPLKKADRRGSSSMPALHRTGPERPGDAPAAVPSLLPASTGGEEKARAIFGEELTGKMRAKLVDPEPS